MRRADRRAFIVVTACNLILGVSLAIGLSTLGPIGIIGSYFITDACREIYRDAHIILDREF